MPRGTTARLCQWRGSGVTEELEVLAIVTDRLEAAAIPDMVTGSFAANYYALPRMTRDIDIVVELAAVGATTMPRERKA
jgi:hypothetical protein